LFYTRLMQGIAEPESEELSEEFSDAWTRELDSDLPVLLDSDDTADDLRDRGAAMLKVFHKEAPRPARVLAVEESFSVDVHDPETWEALPTFVGRFDALVQDDDGRIRLLEHKTAARRYSETKLNYDLQPTAYTLALREMGIDASVIFQVLLKAKKPALVLYDVERRPLDHQDLIATITGVHRAVQAQVFHPVRDWWCKGCQYAGPCLAG